MASDFAINVINSPLLPPHTDVAEIANEIVSGRLRGDVFDVGV
jgi:hypothetical protein